MASTQEYNEIKWDFFWLTNATNGLPHESVLELYLFTIYIHLTSIPLVPSRMKTEGTIARSAEDTKTAREESCKGDRVYKETKTYEWVKIWKIEYVKKYEIDHFGSNIKRHIVAIGACSASMLTILIPFTSTRSIHSMHLLSTCLDN